MTTIPGDVNSLEDLPHNHLLAEGSVQDTLKDTSALAWGRFAHWPSKAQVLHPDKVSARHAHPLLRLTDQLNFDLPWFSNMIGLPTLALLQCDVTQMLERLEHSHSEPSSAAAASASASSSQLQPKRTSLTHQGVVQTGTAVPSPYTVQPGEYDFRFKPSSPSNPFVFICPGYPFMDNQEIKMYNLDFLFASQTRFITSTSSPERIKLFELVKANSSQHSAPIDAAIALAYLPTVKSACKNPLEEHSLKFGHPKTL